MILLEFELNSLISLFTFDSTYTVLIRNVNVLIINFEGGTLVKGGDFAKGVVKELNFPF